MAIVVIALVAIRLIELVPQLAVLRPTLLVSAASAAVLMTRSSRGALASVLKDPALRLVVLFTIWAGLTVPFALYRSEAAESMKVFVPVLLMAFCVLLSPPEHRSIDRIIKGWILAAALMAVVSLAVHHVEIDSDGSLRMGSPVSYDPNDLAGLMAISTALCLGLIFRIKGWRKALWIVAGGVLVLCLAETGSRGGGLALGVATVVFIAGLQFRRAIVMLTISCVVGAALSVAGPESFRQRMSTVTSLDTDYNATSRDGRMAIARRGLHYYAQHPVFGVGIGNFITAEGEHWRSLGIVAKWSAPHNSYMQAFAEMGTAGGVLFLCMMGLAASRAARLWMRGAGFARVAVNHRPELLAAIMGSAVAATFLSHAYFYPLYALMMLIALARRAAVANSRAVDPPPSRRRRR